MIKFLDEALLILAPGVRWRITGEQIYENIVWLDSIENIPTKIDVEAKAKELEAKNALLDERINIIEAYEAGKREASLNKSGKQYYSRIFRGNRLKELLENAKAHL